ncbi:MAG: hypothetical protein K6F78_06000 [Bacteroidaceae bacterium]|nr:hypothetical protein [Bacteroidaceae bacterium]
MKRRLLPLLAGMMACCSLISCNDIEKQADVKLQEAKTAFQQGNYDLAKQLIDSIKVLYPKAFDTRHASLALQREVELAEQNKLLADIESELQEKQQAIADMQDLFVLEKDAEYQRIGNYLDKTQTVEKNIHRSFLRFQVSEEGKLSMTSIYCGSGNIHHTAVKVTAPDGSSAETPNSKDSYETTDLGERIEKADYKYGEDGGVIDFIAAHQDENLKVQFMGDKNYNTTMTAQDRKAAASVLQLSTLLNRITELNKAREEAQLKIRYIEKRIAEKATEEQE